MWQVPLGSLRRILCIGAHSDDIDRPWRQNGDRKVDLLMKHFQTQVTKHWFTRDMFEAMHRIRGIECVSPTGRAEAFYCRKLVGKIV
jgi:hypothetical protein